MIRILIVDDEKIARDSLEWIIRKELGDDAQTVTARNGMEGVDLACEFRPDILLMDVRMPGLSGLDTVKEIRMVLPDLPVIFISAHEDFQYAKQAIVLGAVDYVNKPVNRKDFIQVLHKTLDDQSNIRAERQKTLRLRNEYFLTRPVLEQNLIYGILLSEDQPGPELMEFSDLRSNLQGGGCIFTIQGLPDNELSEKNIAGLDVFRDRIKNRLTCLTGPVIKYSITGLIPLGEGALEEEKIRVKEILVDIWRKLDTDLVRYLKCGVGDHAELEFFHNSYIQSLQVLSNIEMGCLGFISDIPTVTRGLKIDTPEFFGSSDEGAERLLNRLRLEGISLELIRSRLAEESVLKVDRFRKTGNMDDSWFRDGAYLSVLFESQEWQGISDWIILFQSHFINSMRAMTSKSPFLEKALKILDREYSSTDISLESVAVVCRVNPAYLSVKFREVMGVNFMQYLTNLRLDLGCQLLEDPSLSVKEVCYRIGYRDPNYFSRLFRSRFGMPPSYFRKKVRGK
ncbi:MAG: hypothetical protein B6241_15295 [Spirochaetaceae bacterium 4572_59]|nr:MAG: hypothetical protein B6241_15295 [Spirochaetaceae bacterium 4572_59]